MSEKNELPPFMNAARAAQVLNYVDGSSITKLCRVGKISGAYKDGKNWFIPREWVLRRKADDQAAGKLIEGQPRNRVTTGAGLQRKDRGGPGGNPLSCSHGPTSRKTQEK